MDAYLKLYIYIYIYIYIERERERWVQITLGVTSQVLHLFLDYWFILDLSVKKYSREYHNCSLKISN